MNNRYIKRNNVTEEELQNNKIYSRNIPSFFLQPNIDFRPVSTKFSYFQFMDEQPKSNVNINKLPNYNPEKIFFPGDRKPHFSYFSMNVDKETSLRNQFMALQSCDQAVYVPNSNSDLYNSLSNTISSTNIEYKEPQFYTLNDTEKYSSNHKTSLLNNQNNQLFNNNTRLNNYNMNTDNRNKK